MADHGSNVHQHQQGASLLLISRRSASSWSVSSSNRSMKERIKPAALPSYSTSSTLSPTNRQRQRHDSQHVGGQESEQVCSSNQRSQKEQVKNTDRWFWCWPGRTFSGLPSWAAPCHGDAGSCESRYRWRWSRSRTELCLLLHLTSTLTPDKHTG